MREGLLTKKEAVMLVEVQTLDHLLHKRLDPKSLEKAEFLAKGLPASPGGTVGRIVFEADDAVELAEKGEDVILARLETSPEDIIGMNASKGILTVRGGMTSHAAVVARGMGKTCVAGCSDIVIDYETQTLKVKGHTFHKGDFLSLDGTFGDVYKGKIDLLEPKLTKDFFRILKWAKKFKRMIVKTNAEEPKEIKTALEFLA